MAAVVVEARANGAAHPVVVLVRAAAHGRGLPRRAGHLGSRSACSTATSRSTASPTFVLTTAERARDLPQPAGVRGRVRAGPPAAAPPPAALAARRHHGRRRRDLRARLWAALGTLGPRRRPAAGLRRLLAVRVVLARGARLLPGRRGAPLRRATAASASPTAAFPRCPAAARSATAACTACRRCSSATSSSRGGPATASCPPRTSGSPAIRRPTAAAPCSTAANPSRRREGSHERSRRQPQPVRRRRLRRR